MKLDIKKAEFLKDKLVEGIARLDELFDEIWNLKYKDFEDLKWGIKHYEELYDNMDDLTTEIDSIFGDDDKACDDFIWDLKNRLFEHLDNIDFFKK